MVSSKRVALSCQNLEAEIGREGRRRTIDAPSVGLTVVVAVFVGRWPVQGRAGFVFPRGSEALVTISSMCMQTRTYSTVYHFLA